MTFLTLPEYKGEKTSFVSVETRHIKPVKVGDRLNISAKLVSVSRGLAKGEAIGTTGGGACLEIKFLIAVPSIMKSFLPQEK